MHWRGDAVRLVSGILVDVQPAAKHEVILFANNSPQRYK